MKFVDDDDDDDDTEHMLTQHNASQFGDKSFMLPINFSIITDTFQ